MVGNGLATRDRENKGGFRVQEGVVWKGRSFGFEGLGFGGGMSLVK